MSIKRTEGRNGEDTEFVEFEISDRKRIIAQKGSGGFWYIFDLTTGPKGTVKTVESFLPEEKERAVTYARELAEARAK